MTRFVNQHKAHILEDLADTPGYLLCERLTWEVDTIVLQALNDALAETMPAPAVGPARLPERWALMALGGYGRGQMCLRSDIDIQVVIPDGAPDPLPLMEHFLDRLTQRGLKLGHGVRTITESVLLAKDEVTFATAALTARHLAGDPTTTEAVRGPVFAHMNGPGLKRLIEFVEVDRQRRSERLGDTVFVLEPDLKHGIGGLRDAQTVGWLSLVTGRPFDRKVAFAEDLLLRVRLALHALVTFKCDRLSLEYQDVVGRALGYEGEDDLPAEHLMRDVHLALRALSSRARRHLESAAHRLSTPRRVPIEAHPGWVRVIGRGERLARADGAFPRTIADAARALRVAARTGLLLEADSENAFEDLAEHLRLNSEVTPAPPAPLPTTAPLSTTARLKRPRESAPDPELAAVLMELLLDPADGASKALHTLHRTGLLTTLVPEFSRVLGRVQRDLYHVYTVDEHTLRAIDKMKALARGDVPALELGTERIAALDDTTRRALYVALFLHDLGKGYGPGHHERGAELAAVIGPRLGLSADEVEQVQLLVRHQADMPLICLRRDLADPRPVRGLARIVGDVPTLDALYLLSIADWSSVGPQAFSSWQRSLLDILYLRTRDQILDPGIYADPVGFAEDKRDQLATLVLGEVPQAPGAASDPIDDFCSALPTRYFQLVDLPTMQAHFRLWSSYLDDLEPRAPRVDVRHDPEHAQAVVTVVCADSPGVLARLTGGLAEVGAEVLSAEIASLASDQNRAPTVLDQFRVADPHGRFAGPRGTALLHDALLRALAGEPTRPRERQGLAPTALPRIKPRVDVHNEAATGHSVLDVITGDRPGLLHDLARFFHAADISVDLAFVTTEGRVAHDSFYVVARTGDKLDDASLAALGARLTDHLEATI